MGGKPDECVIFEMLVYHLIDDDDKLKEIKEECLSGTLLCGDCKNRTCQLLENFLDDLHEKQIESREIAETIFD